MQREGRGPGLGGIGCAIQAAAVTAARQRREVQGGEPERERARALVPSGARDLLLPEVEEAAGERGRIVLIAGAPGAHPGGSIADPTRRPRRAVGR